MSHSTVLVVIRDAENAQEAESMLDVILAPFDENDSVDPYPEWQDADDVGRAVKFYREHPEYCPGDDDGPIKPFDEFVGDGDLEAWNEWTRQAVGSYCRTDRNDGIYDAENDRFGYMSEYNPRSRWDWWALGGRWNGFFQLKPGVDVGGEPVPAWRTHVVGAEEGRVEGSLQVQTFDGSQDAILGASGVFGNSGDESFEGRADLARKSAIDFEAMRALAGHRASTEYDLFEQATEDIEVAERWADVLKRTFFDNNRDPDEPMPALETEEEREAWRLEYRGVINEARETYNSQPWIQALQGANLMSFMGDPHDDFCISEGGRVKYIQRAIDAATSTFAMLLDGEWYEKGKMGWFGSVGGEKDPDQWHREQARKLDSLPDDVFLALVDVHI